VAKGLKGALPPFLVAATLVAAAVQLDRDSLSLRPNPKDDPTYISMPCELALTGLELFDEDEQFDRVYRRDQNQRTCLVLVSSEAIEVRAMHPLSAQLFGPWEDYRHHYDELRLTLPLESLRSCGEEWGHVRSATVSAFRSGGCFGTGFYRPASRELHCIVRGERVHFDGPLGPGRMTLSWARSAVWRAIAERPNAAGAP